MARAQMVAAGLLGLAGVMLLAAGAHTAGSLATTAGEMLLFHAPAIMAAATARKLGLLDGRLADAAIWIMAAGVTLFAADLYVRTLGWPRLFMFAAPAGGSATMLSWLVLSIAAMRKPA